MFHAYNPFSLSTVYVGMAFFIARITYAACTAVATHYLSPHQAVFLLPLMQDILCFL
mgnify:CR=1 FL=1